MNAVMELPESDIDRALRITQTMQKAMVYNYAFGWDGTCPENEIDLTCWYTVDSDGHPRIERIEDDKGKRLILPCSVIEDIEDEIEDELFAPRSEF